jgi:hypothetical protein
MTSLGRFPLFGLIVVLFMSSLSFSETTCTVKDCEITITLKIAFSGSEATDTYINNAENEIENTWNGPNGYRTVGDCKCKMTFEVITNKTADCKNNPPAGWHCIMVTDYNNDPPRNQTNWTGASFYIGYMYGIATGNGSNSQTGWWSDIMSRPVPGSTTGETYKDFAHEAGHMMGLNDSEGGIMNDTSGANSNPTQQNLDDIASRICGANYCPDSCCCGNGKVDKNKGEQCDPAATPIGCSAGLSCCPVCCSCFGPVCIPANGEYLSQSACQTACGTGAKCYKNYKTGCWDCVKKTVVVTETCYDPENIRGNTNCDHSPRSFVEQGRSFYEDDLADMPVLGAVFSSERINVETDEGDEGYLVTQEGSVSDYGQTSLSDPTVTIFTNRQTIALISSQDMSVHQALSAGNISYEGEGILNGIKFGAYHFAFDVYNLFNPAPVFTPPTAEAQFPQGYYDAMEEFDVQGASEGYTPLNTDALPDGGYFGEDVYPS